MNALQYIFKINNFCNLDCLYCYQSYSNYRSLNLTPKEFDHATMMSCARAAVLSGINGWHGPGAARLSFVLQGGEPLLCGKQQVDRLLSALRVLEDELGVELLLNIHSNGARIDLEWCEILLRNACSLTVSLDGPAEVHDRARYDHMGRPTHQKVVAGVRTALTQGVDTGCMCVVSPEACGHTTQRFFEDLGIRRIGYLLPTMQSGRPQGTGGYGRFLKGAFDAWLDSPYQGVRVQLFEAALRAHAGKPSGLAGVGGYRAAWISFTTDGAVEAGDPFGLCEFGRIEGPPDVAIRAAQSNPFYRLQAQGGFIPRAGPCRDCAVRDICQGGFLAHRHDGHGGFDQPSYYCPDLYDFYSHIRGVMSELADADPAH
jgi:uncharacterized protein